MNDEMRPDDEQRSRLLRLRSIDAEFAHTVVQSGAVEAQARGCAGREILHHDVRPLDDQTFQDRLSPRVLDV